MKIKLNHYCISFLGKLVDCQSTASCVQAITLSCRIVTSHIVQGSGSCKPYSMRPFGSSLASGSIGTSKLSNFRREQSEDSSRVSSQKQNNEGVVRAQNGQYRATTESSSGCGGARAGM
ncbi:hypothetical protein DVH24_028366 [Malus domestica]|uniref:Uncharacterized protein n=1 Tax=Malus domestica TaxID=3750 RepID=A0A498HB18_MALDO|nr:hypothetical protein DVH24_028366 [Malus domestica]